jgi:hypothetical protein
MRLVAGFSSRLPQLDPRSSHMGFVVEKWHWDRFSLSNSVFPPNSHSSNYFALICRNHSGLVQ